MRLTVRQAASITLAVSVVCAWTVALAHPADHMSPGSEQGRRLRATDMAGIIGGFSPSCQPFAACQNPSDCTGKACTNPGTDPCTNVNIINHPTYTQINAYFPDSCKSVDGDQGCIAFGFTVPINCIAVRNCHCSAAAGNTCVQNNGAFRIVCYNMDPGDCYADDCGTAPSRTQAKPAANGGPAAVTE